MILFLNMRDLFAAKIKTVNIKDVCEFSDYSGPSHSYVAGTYIISVLASSFLLFYSIIFYEVILHNIALHRFLCLFACGLL